MTDGTASPWLTSGKDLLPMLEPVMKAMVAASGANCEVVLHDLSEGVDHSIIAIENGQVTGRAVGDPSTNLGLQVLQSNDEGEQFGYRATTDDGRELRCSSTYFRNDAGTVVAALCVNVDLTPYQSVRGMMEELLDYQSATDQEEVFAHDITTVLQHMIDQALRQVGTPVPKMTKPERMRVIEILDRRGAFVVKRAVETVAGTLRISKVTAYAYLDEVRTAPES